jgi:hypothetical protein
MDEKHIHEYEKSFLDFFNGGEDKNIGYVTPIAVRRIHEHSLDISFIANHIDRTHEVSVGLPKKELVVCVGCWQYDEKPRLFVKSEWLDNLHVRQNSIFLRVDAIDVKKAINKGTLARGKLLKLRAAIDELASKYPDIFFISYADNILLKSNWTAGHFVQGIKYTYRPEVFLYIFRELQSIHKEILDLTIYGVFTQGSNEYYDDELLHKSKSGNHVSFNSLGVPFADLDSIEETAKSSSKKGDHPFAELYMDKDFFRSLQFKSEFDKKTVDKHKFDSKMRATSSFYYYSQCKGIIDNLKEPIED